MSMLGGLFGGGGDSFTYTPTNAPKPPMRSDAVIAKQVANAYRKAAKRDSYAQAVLGGSYEAPAQSYTAQLFSEGTIPSNG